MLHSVAQIITLSSILSVLFVGFAAAPALAQENPSEQEENRTTFMRAWAIARRGDIEGMKREGEVLEDYLLYPYLEYNELLAIRRTVFIDGQDVPEDLEVDGLDSECTHFLVTVDGVPVGTARLREVSGAGKVERVAVLPEYRGRGLGRDLMHAMHAEAARRDLPRLKLNAQQAVVGFYSDLGYDLVGEPFVEAGIPHQAMRREPPFV